MRASDLCRQQCEKKECANLAHFYAHDLRNLRIQKNNNKSNKKLILLIMFNFLCIFEQFFCAPFFLCAFPSAKVLLAHYLCIFAHFAPPPSPFSMSISICQGLTCAFFSHFCWFLHVFLHILPVFSAHFHPPRVWFMLPGDNGDINLNLLPLEKKIERKKRKEKIRCFLSLSLSKASLFPSNFPQKNPTPTYPFW